MGGVGEKERMMSIPPAGCRLLDAWNEVNTTERMCSSHRAEKAENFGQTGVSALHLSDIFRPACGSVC